MGPYFPPEDTGRPAPPIYPAQPGLLLLTAALAVVVALIARDITRRRRAANDRVVDELIITWLPADAVALDRPDLCDGGWAGDANWSSEEELSFGPVGRPRRPGRQATPS